MDLQNGIFPTMIVAYDSDGKLDLGAQGELLDWYMENHIHGLFALCHSTESHWLSWEERITLAKFVHKKINGRIPVVYSGITAEDIETQLEQAKEIYSIGADAVVFLRNRLGNDYDIFRHNLDRICSTLPDSVPLGMYECPYPYQQHLTDPEFREVVKTNRFRFLKDTVCNTAIMRNRQAIRADIDPSFRVYNANCATLLESLRFGYNGFSGIMANFHPDLYVWMYENQSDPRADILDKYLGMMSVIEMRCYPICAKRYLAKYEKIHITDLCRCIQDTTVDALWSELEDVYQLTEIARSLIL